MPFNSSSKIFCSEGIQERGGGCLGFWFFFIQYSKLFILDFSFSCCVYITHILQPRCTAFTNVLINCVYCHEIFSNNNPDHKMKSNEMSRPKRDSWLKWVTVRKKSSESTRATSVSNVSSLRKWQKRFMATHYNDTQ